MAKSRDTDKTDSKVATPVTLETATTQSAKSTVQSELAQALIQAIELTRPEQKKNAFNRKVGTPWTPKDGTPKPKLKRKMFQHGLPIDEDISSSKEIDLMNQLRPGVFMGGLVKVNRRKDRGLDLDYHIKTASQRLKLINQFGIRNLEELLSRCIEEASNPVKFAVSELE